MLPLAPSRDQFPPPTATLKPGGRQHDQNLLRAYENQTRVSNLQFRDAIRIWSNFKLHRPQISHRNSASNRFSASSLLKP